MFEARKEAVLSDFFEKSHAKGGGIQAASKQAASTKNQAQEPKRALHLACYLSPPVTAPPPRWESPSKPHDTPGELPRHPPVMAPRGLGAKA